MSEIKNKFTNYYDTEEKIKELSEYVHLNYKLILTKMTSELRRKLDIDPHLDSTAYYSLMGSLSGRLFNEMIYSLSGTCQSLNLSFIELIPIKTIQILFDLIEGKNPLEGRIRTDVKEDIDGFRKYYLEEIDKLRKHIESLPK